jgi:hypothetical protein
MNARRLTLSLLTTTLGSLAFTAAPALAAAPETPELTVGSPVKASEATFLGILSPAASAPNEGGTYKFLYKAGGSCEGGSQTAGGLALGAAHEELPGEPVSGLTADTEYTVCLSETNLASQTTLSAPVTFKTALPPETPVTTSPAQSITATTATFEGVLNPVKAGEAGNYEFLYRVSPTKCEGESATPAGAATGALTEKVKAELAALQPHATYTFCLLARNTAGETAVGAPVTFETGSAKPTVESESVSAVNASEAHLEGTVNPNNQTTECKFQYGTEPTLTGAITVLCEPATFPAVFGPQPVGLKLTGLQPHTTYYYRVLASDATGTELGTIKSFPTATSPETPESLEAQPLTATTATLKGVLNANNPGEAGTYEFAYRQSANQCQGGTPEEDKSTPSTASTGAHPEPVSAAITELLPATQYTFCLIAHNGAGESSQSSETFTTASSAPEVTSEYVTTVESTLATLNARINPDGSATTYRFQYGPTEAYGQETAETPLPATGLATVTLSGLTPGATYHYHVIATSAEAPTGIPGKDKTLTTTTPPSGGADTCPNAQARAEQPFASHLPDCRAYEMVSPLDKGDHNTGNGSARVSLSGEAVTYNSTGVFAEPEGGGITNRYLARRDPAHGGWSTENLSPPHSQVATPTARAFEELLFTPELTAGVEKAEFIPLVAGESAGFYNIYVGDLTSKPITYRAVTHFGPSNAVPYHQLFPVNLSTVGASTDLDHVLVASNMQVNETEPVSGAEGLYDSTAGNLAPVGITPAGTPFEHGVIIGANGGAETANPWHAVSSNGHRVIFTGAELGNGLGGQIYLRENPEQPQSPVAPSASGEGDLTSGSTLVTAVTTGGEFLVGQKITGDGIPHGAAIIAATPGTLTLSAPAALTASAVALQAGGECTVAADACTIAVSASQRTIRDPNSEVLAPHPHQRPAFYRDADETGTHIFFVSRAELTNDAKTGAADNAANLYEYDRETGSLTDLTVDETDAKGAAVLGLVNAGENVGDENSYLYFVANGILASNKNANNETAHLGNCRENVEGELLSGNRSCNLYADHFAGGIWTTTYVASLAGGDAVEHADEADWIGLEDGTNDSFDFGPGEHTARITPDGTTLAFESQRSLTGYDTQPANAADCTDEEHASSPCSEVYLYDAATSTLVCASCDRSGSPPVGRAELGGVAQGEGFVIHSPYYLPRNLSDTGRRLFFNSADPLVPHTSNGQTNVYEWEADGEGSCTTETGCVFPISNVAGNSSTEFLDASPNGNDVFLNTADQLVRSDTDTRIDVYDVRAGGGFPETSAPPPCNNGDSCKPPVSPQPGIFAPPGSATFSGPGNAVPPPPSTTVLKSKTAAQIRAERLAKALKACKKLHSHKRRTACQKQAHKKYGAATKTSAHRANRASNDRRATR